MYFDKTLIYDVHLLSIVILEGEGVRTLGGGMETL